MRFHVVAGQGDREENEDCARAAQKDGAALFLLADGLGGHGKGGEAARIAVEAFEGVFLGGAAACLGGGDAAPSAAPPAAPPAASSAAPAMAALVARGFAEGQRALLDRQRQLGSHGELRTTLVCLLVCGGIACWGHIGDSRLYRFRGPRLVSRTRDHSVPQMLVESGDIRERDIRFHEDRSHLLRAMGADWDSCGGCEISACEPVEAGDGFLLCSDGFWEPIDEKAMSRLRKRHADAEAWLVGMEAAVAASGRRRPLRPRRRQLRQLDNYSAIAVVIT